MDLSGLNLSFLKHIMVVFSMAGNKGRRDRHDIIVQILEAATGGAVKTRIMHKAKLSFAQINEYLPLLVRKGFLESQTMMRHRKIKTVLRTSKLGEEFIRNYKALGM